MIINQKNDYGIYTPLLQIKRELSERRKNKALVKKVKDFFGDQFLGEIEDAPRAILSRTIATPNMELDLFLKLANKVRLSPLILEYPDKFVAKNVDKYHLCKLFFFRENSNGVATLANTLKIVNFNEEEGKVFGNIKTVWGEKIVDVHHKLLYIDKPALAGKVVDFSQWFSETRYLSKYYYLYYLSLFVCHGVLFENFLAADKEESRFFQEKFLPSFKEVENIFGIKPLIYQLLPLENTKNIYWHSYPESLKLILEKPLEKTKL
jgi:hypothetical protein